MWNCLLQQKSASTLLLVQGPSPCRVNGNLISFNNELYIFGGMPTTFYLNPPTLLTDKSLAWFKKGEDYLMRLDSKTHSWQSEGSAGLPQRAWAPYHYSAVTGQLQQLLPSSLPAWFLSLLLKCAATHLYPVVRQASRPQYQGLIRVQTWIHRASWHQQFCVHASVSHLACLHNQA